MEAPGRLAVALCRKLTRETSIMRFKSKQEFVESVEKEPQAFVELVRSVPNERYREAGVWGDGWTIHDLLAHLTEWEQMCLGWYQVGRNGGQPIMSASGFKWNETPRLNQAIWGKHRLKPARKVVDEFEASYQEIFSLIRQISQNQLLVPGQFAWTGKYPLTTYLAPNTCSHYRFATKVVKRWLKRVTLDKSAHTLSDRNQMQAVRSGR
jgi:hypothetical protein